MANGEQMLAARYSFSIPAVATYAKPSRNSVMIGPCGW